MTSHTSIPVPATLALRPETPEAKTIPGHLLILIASSSRLFAVAEESLPSFLGKLVNLSYGLLRKPKCSFAPHPSVALLVNGNVTQYITTGLNEGQGEAHLGNGNHF